jgi:hypothetical protein
MSQSILPEARLSRRHFALSPPWHPGFGSRLWSRANGLRRVRMRLEIVPLEANYSQGQLAIHRSQCADRGDEIHLLSSILGHTGISDAADFEWSAHLLGQSDLCVR